uniref:Cytochrome b-c1 complex subunit 8 n=1 Tax=Felis catus TaxID=9685 RepID=A0ABI7XYK2_FELCA
MGREFGHLTRMRHVITYSLSPFEQRAFPHYFSKGIPNVLRRTRACILRVLPRECLGRVGGLDFHHTPTAGPFREHCR